jgi:hypothetical protein
MTTRRTIGLPTPTSSPKQQTEFLRTTKEILEVAQRQRGDPMKSFVRLEELQQLGLVNQLGGLGPSVSETAAENETAHSRLRHLAYFRGI